MAERGLITSEETESTRSNARTNETSGLAQGDAKAGAKLPFLGEVSGSLGGNLEHRRADDQSAAGVSRQRFEFSQSYYLHWVRRLLRDNGWIKPLEKRDDAASLVIGDFFEFQAHFRADEASAILDIATPDLVSGITRYIERRKTITGLDDLDDFNKLQLYTEKRRIAEEAKAELAFAVAKAVRVDFRSDATRQYYGKVHGGDEPLHVITICESRHFIVEDQDRILDGDFSVLGKVVSLAQEDTPMLERNKFLDRVDPAFLDEIFTSMEAATNSASTSLTPGGMKISTPETIFNTKLHARLEGTAIKVIPIAIFA
jgi:hypothetical protein